MPKPKTVKDYEALAKRIGWTWLGEFPNNTDTNTGWLCPRGHRRSASYGNLSQGMGCGDCQREDQGARQRHPPEDYHALASERGYIWIGPEVSGALEKTVWECGYGHRWSGRYADIQQGHGCYRCGKQRAGAKKRRQPGEYHAIAASQGFTWLGPEVTDNKKKTWWRCAAGHECNASFNQIQRGDGCRKCSGLEPKTAQDFFELAALRGFKWVGKELCNTFTRTTWECSEGHAWSTTHSSIKQGSGCPHCAGLVRKMADDYCRLAEATGVVWLGPLPVNGKGITNWRCSKGHIMKKSFGSLRANHGCLECSGQTPKTPDDFHELASQHGFQWIGPEVSNTATKTWWMCSKGHKWEARYGTIYMGHGCHECLDLVNGRRVSNVQRRICEMVGGELNAPFGRYRIDIAQIIDNVRIAIEYDSWYFHGNNEQRDRAKDKDLVANGWRVLRIRSNTLTPTQDQLDEAVRQLVAGEPWVDIELPDWGKGRVAWFFK